jgi:hypothetical protein
MMDIFKRQKDIKYDECQKQENIKKYYIIPLKIVENNQKLSYKVDEKLLMKVEKLCMNGYKNEQKNIIEWLKERSEIQMIEKLKNIILVKEDKPSNCYTYSDILANLKKTKAEDVAKAIRGKPENLGC